jgi:hypothetical protein
VGTRLRAAVVVAMLGLVLTGSGDAAAARQFHENRLHLGALFDESQTKIYSVFTDLVPPARQWGGSDGPQHVEGADFCDFATVEEAVSGVNGQIEMELAYLGRIKIINRNARSVPEWGRRLLVWHYACDDKRSLFVSRGHIVQVQDSYCNGRFWPTAGIELRGVGNIHRRSFSDVLKYHIHGGGYALAVRDQFNQWSDVRSEPWPLLKDQGFLCGFRCFHSGIGRLSASIDGREHVGRLLSRRFSNEFELLVASLPEFQRGPNEPSGSKEQAVSGKSLVLEFFASASPSLG